MTGDVATRPGARATLEDKVAFLRRPDTYGGSVAEVTVKETHMSWVFLAGRRVYKLKKPVRTPYLDFSTLARRETACRAEFALNRRLAPDVYLGVEPLTADEDGLAIGGGGEVADWLVVTRRLDARWMLDAALEQGLVEIRDLDRVVAVLARFYRRARRVPVRPEIYLSWLRRGFDDNRRVLADPRLELPRERIERIDRALRAFLVARRRLLEARVRERRIVDGHGDLRPEHVWMGEPIRIIDCLEFNAALRAVDPYEEIAYLDLECRRLGHVKEAAHLRHAFARALGHAPPDGLYLFHRCHRAMLRARLAISHLLEPHPRTPEKWPRVTRDYLALADRDARRLRQFVRTRFR